MAADAEALVECGRLLDADEGADDDAWQLATVALRSSSAQIVTAARVTDLTAAGAHFEDLNTACSSCHRDCDAAYRLPW